ncbi:hypothetical protein DSC45_02730 [Streptomyces sp. YIM 130001]|uniref:hypothetical protein n=1 Tax=Streptomyces sp. YIM 130001 TaxID=2259644 RepID=UPI000E65A0D6|nr:hypothetical protein [Streptomyces sp. YIM 130001]RII20736.1 hypothetical protein DSC45_02730 [Streptomyces sp. YIM 130001]
MAKVKAKKNFVALQYQAPLADWERKNDADGVFRAQNAPASFAVKADSAKATQDSAFVVATFKWEGAENTRVEYQVDAKDEKIRNIEELG